MTAPLADAAAAAAQVVARLRAVAAPGATVEVYGSCVYAPGHAGDVDVLVCDDDAARLAAAIGLPAIPTTPPRLRGLLDGVPVDVTVVNGDDEVARGARSGPPDAAALVAHLAAHARAAAFAATWPHVRRFVRARALGGNGLGWFGSFGWALLLAAPLTDPRALAAATPGAVLPGWLRWLAGLPSGITVGLDGTRPGPSAFYLTAPTPPARDVARLSARTAAVLFTEARHAAAAIGDAADDATALARIADLADAPPPGATLIIAGDDDHSRGRYEGAARGILRALEPLGAVRSWGRLDDDGDGGWQHRVTVPAHRARSAREVIRDALALAMIDATIAPS